MTNEEIKLHVAQLYTKFGILPTVVILPRKHRYFKADKALPHTLPDGTSTTLYAVSTDESDTVYIAAD